MKPIYLLCGSIIHYNLSITSTQRLNASHSACLYLFENASQFETFITDTYFLVQIIDSHCFTPAATREPTLASHSFTISNAGQYYVAIELQNGVMVKANASVVRVYYNTEGLSAYCSNASECQIEKCHKFLCSHSSTTYIVVHAPILKAIYSMILQQQPYMEQIMAFFVRPLYLDHCFAIAATAFSVAHCVSYAKITGTKLLKEGAIHI